MKTKNKLYCSDEVNRIETIQRGSEYNFNRTCLKHFTMPETHEFESHYLDP